MDSVRCRFFLLAFLVVWGCQLDGLSSNTGIGDDAKAVISAIDPYALRVSPDRLSRIDIHGPLSEVTFERVDKQWKIVSPVEYPPSPYAIDSILGVVAGVEIMSAEEETPATLRSRGLDEKTAIAVKVWVGDVVERHYRVGYGTHDRTFVQRDGDHRILAVRGRCRPILDRHLDQFRLAVVTDIDSTLVETVTYRNVHGRLDMVADPPGSARFRLRGRIDPLFDTGYASTGVGVVTHLMAKGFADPPLPDGTGLFSNDASRVSVRWREGGEPKMMEVWIGSKTVDNRLYVRTSLSEQVYLVPGNLESTLVPRKRDFVLVQLQAKPRDSGAERHAKAHEEHGHGLPKERPKAVPEAMLGELRVMAREQAGR